jgi:hypothetical protein
VVHDGEGDEDKGKISFHLIRDANNATFCNQRMR